MIHKIKYLYYNILISAEDITYVFQIFFQKCEMNFRKNIQITLCQKFDILVNNISRQYLTLSISNLSCNLGNRKYKYYV